MTPMEIALTWPLSDFMPAVVHDLTCWHSCVGVAMLLLVDLGFGSPRVSYQATTRASFLLGLLCESVVSLVASFITITISCLELERSLSVMTSAPK